MQFPLTISVVTWGVLAAVVAALALYRKYVCRDELDIVHIRESESVMVGRQKVLAHRLDTIDRWGKLLTAALVLYGLAVGSAILYAAWQESLKKAS